ncbi:MAG: hypothetical protein NTY64_07480, partial [Deltaproteobacteria bacterium]|nr:hypothetical protein [Deltaproteobacteria bacterium]
MKNHLHILIEVADYLLIHYASFSKTPEKAISCPKSLSLPVREGWKRSLEMIRWALALAILMTLWVPLAKCAEIPAESDLKKAIAIMRRTAEVKIPEEREKRSKDLDWAWKMLINAGPNGASALKEELRKLEASKEKDDLFKLGAAVVLWRIGKADEAESIAALWAGDVDLNANYAYVFFIAFQAARTEDPRVFPMLIATLKDQKGVVYSPHNVRVSWPLSHSFIWGSLGAKGLPVLERVLQDSRDEVSIASAIALLGTAQDLDAIE